MPLQSPPRKISETENMLGLLCCVDALGSVTATQLWVFVAQLELMDYVTMRLCLHKLLGAGELEYGEGSLDEHLLLTDRGREALQLFGDRLPKAVRARVSSAAPEFHGRMLSNQQVRAVYEMAKPSEYRLCLSVCEGDLPTIRLRMHTNSRPLAGKAIHRFSANAAMATTYLYGLAEEATQNTVTSHAAGELTLPAITEHSATEYTASVILPGKKAQYEVALLLPTRKAAEAFVTAMQPNDVAASTAKRLTELVSSPVRVKKPRA